MTQLLDGRTAMIDGGGGGIGGGVRAGAAVTSTAFDEAKGVPTVDWKIELVLLPVTDVDRAKEFYTGKVGFGVHVDHRAGDDFRVVQLDPPGSACSIAIGTGITDAAPGSVRGLHLVVSDIVAARAELAGRGVDVSEVRHLESGEWVAGPDPRRSDYNSFADFRDPDGNTWVLQEVGRRAAGA